MGNELFSNRFKNVIFIEINTFAVQVIFGLNIQLYKKMHILFCFIADTTKKNRLLTTSAQISIDSFYVQFLTFHAF